MPLDDLALVTDDLGVPVTGATVWATASGPNGSSWSGALPDAGGGQYQICGVGAFDNGTIVVSITVSKPGYYSTSASATAAYGYWCP